LRYILWVLKKSLGLAGKVRYKEAFLDRDKTKDVWNCAVTHYEFDPSIGTAGKLVSRYHSKIFYGSDVASAGCQNCVIIT
jgi:hypothetical protein